jgi:probable rRNA maturation factor
VSRGVQKYRISIRQQIRPAPFRAEVLRALVRRSLRFLNLSGADLRILVVGDEEMERWNREFLGRSGTTNVISFSEEDAGQETSTRVAGDILLSAPACLSQTRDWPCSKEERVFYFIVHGVAHLLGYDHDKGGVKAARMRREEVRVYRSCLKEGRSPI